MRTTLIAACSILLIVLGVCVFSIARLNAIVKEMDELRMLVVESIAEGRREEASVQIAQMATIWQTHLPTLEIIGQHEDLHDITMLIIEADANFDTKDDDDFNRSMALLGEALHHLAHEEQPTLSNIL